jgi:preprotein translocase subunit SecY
LPEEENAGELQEGDKKDRNLALEEKFVRHPETSCKELRSFEENMAKFLEIFRHPDTRKKVLIIMGLLVFFRLLAAIPLPGVNLEALKQLLAANNFFGILNIFSGGAMGKLSIALLGVGPYITATIILQVLTMIFPRLKEYYEEGDTGRAKFNRLSRFITIPLAILQTYALLTFLVSQKVFPAFGLLDLSFWINALTATATSMILLWVGEIIDEQKLGNGVSLIIFAGILAGLPMSLGNVYSGISQGLMGWDVLLVFVALTLIVIAAVVFVNQGEHKITVSYPKRVRGSRVYGGVESYLPIRVNQAGVIPIIFAMAMLSFPQMIGQLIAGFAPSFGTGLNEAIARFMNNQLAYGALYFLLVFIFTYFYTSVVFNPGEISKNLQRSGGFIPGIRPGEPTSKYLKSIVGKITLFGALFLGIIAVLPIATQSIVGQNFTIGGTALLIVVSVALESWNQIDSQLKMREYEVNE